MARITSREPTRSRFSPVWGTPGPQREPRNQRSQSLVLGGARGVRSGWGAGAARGRAQGWGGHRCSRRSCVRALRPSSSSRLPYPMCFFLRARVSCLLYNSHMVAMVGVPLSSPFSFQVTPLRLAPWHPPVASEREGQGPFEVLPCLCSWPSPTPVPSSVPVPARPVPTSARSPGSAIPCACPVPARPVSALSAPGCLPQAPARSLPEEAPGLRATSLLPSITVLVHPLFCWHSPKGGHSTPPHPCW